MPNLNGKAPVPEKTHVGKVVTLCVVHTLQFTLAGGMIESLRKLVRQSSTSSTRAGDGQYTCTDSELKEKAERPEKKRYSN